MKRKLKKYPDGALISLPDQAAQAAADAQMNMNFQIDQEKAKMFPNQPSNELGNQVNPLFANGPFPGYSAGMVGSGLINTGLGVFHNIKQNLDNKAYQDYWLREYQQGSLVTNPNKFGNLDLMKDGGIYIKPSKRGTFTKWAKDRGMGVQEAARKVLENKEDYSSAIVKKANFARNASKWELGGETNVSANIHNKDFATIEAEGGEKILGNGLYSINGPSHSNGGVPVMATPGDFVFSDKKELAVPEEIAKQITGRTLKNKSSRTPAKLASKYMKFNEMMQKAEDPEQDDITRRTALYNIQNFVEKLGDIANVQEALKGYPEGAPNIMAMGGKVKNMKPLYEEAGYFPPYVDPYKGNRGKVRKSQQQRGLNPSFNKFNAPWLKDFGFENTPGGIDSAIKSLGFTGNTNDNEQVQAFIVGSLIDKYNRQGFTPGQTIFDKLNTEFGLTNQGVKRGLKNDFLPFTSGPKITGDETKNIVDNYVDLLVGRRTGEELHELFKLQNPQKNTPETVPGPRRLPMETVPGPRRPGDVPIPQTKAPTLGKPAPIEFQKRNYANQVLPNVAELYSFFAANKRYAPRYPIAQKFYEGDNIDALLNSGFLQMTAQPELNALQRQLNSVNQLPTTPLGVAQQVGLQSKGLSAASDVVSQIQRANIGRKDQQLQALAQNQALKGQYRLQHQKNYVNELETVKNNMELADKNRMANTGNILNNFVQRVYGTRYANAMNDYFQIDPYGDIKALPVDIAKEVKGARPGQSQDPVQLLMQISAKMRSGEISPESLKSLNFFDDLARGLRLRQQQ